MKKVYFLLVTYLCCLAISSTAQVTTTYSVVGTYTYTVLGTAVSIDMAGAQGGTDNAGSPGGLGGRVQCTLATSIGEVLTVYVGGVGTNGSTSVTVKTGGANGSPDGGADGGAGYYYGAGGGGASDIRLGGTAFSNRILVAGAGGGAGQNCNTSTGENGGAGGGTTGGGGYECGSISGCIAGNGGTPSSGGLGATCYTSTNGGVGIGGGNSYTSWVGGGGGGYYGGGSGQYGGGGGGSSYYSSPGVTAGTTTSGYQTGNGYVQITLLCIPPGTIGANTPVCPGANITLTETTPGGTWSSSNTGIATVNSTSGLVTGILPGTATITYTVGTPCSPLATAVVTVSPVPSVPSAIAICPGATATLTDTAHGGSWSSGSPAIASVGATTGILSAVATGTASITYSYPAGGCAAASTFTVYPLPTVFNVTGGGAFCSGGTGVHVRLSGSVSGSTYQLFNGVSSVGSPVSGSGSTIDFGLQTGTGSYTVVATNTATGCTNNMAGSATVTNNPLPPAITGLTTVCAGNPSLLGDAVSGGTWTSSNTSVATVVIGTGAVTSITAGTANISYTLSSTGCSISTPFVVNPIPAPIGGASAICVGATTTLSSPGGTGVWASSSPTIAAINTSSAVVSGLSNGVATITFTSSVTGCFTSASLAVNSLPDSTDIVTGGGSYCAGGLEPHVDLSYSNPGINYQLYQNGLIFGSALPGSTSSLDFGPQGAGIYTVRATNPITGCSSKMSGSVNVTLAASPNVYNVTGGGGLCAGSPGLNVGLSGSQAGVQYQLLNGATDIGSSVPGIGSSFNFGAYSSAGSYTVTALDTISGCGAPMNGIVTISVNPLPTTYAVGGGGSFCAGTLPGVDISMGGSTTGVTYVLSLGSTTMSTIISTGGGIDFGHYTLPGLYTVTATNSTSGCSTTMTGGAIVVVNPAPTVYNVTGGGGYCAGAAGVHVGLSFSSTGIQYQLWDGVSTVGSAVSGSGTSLDFGIISTTGTYTVTAVNPLTTCASNMAGSAVVSINVPPNVENLSSGGSYCVGSAGIPITSDFSQPGIQYQLYRGGVVAGPATTGSGPGVNFGTFTLVGSYTAVATDPVTGCTANLNGVATISVNPLPSIYSVTGGGSYCSGDTGVDVMLSGSQPGINYFLYYDGVNTGFSVPGTGTAVGFGAQTGAGVYQVVASNGATSCVNNMFGSATVIMNSLPTQYNVVGGGGYCPGGVGVHVGLDGSSTGTSYQLLYGFVSSGLPLSGSGLPVDFGAKTGSGTYNVIATNLITGCSGPMIGSATISLNTPPNNYTVSGSGSYCAHGAGLPVSIAGSDAGTNYQLYIGGVASGLPVPGSGVSFVFGTYTRAGIYTVVATNTAGCSAPMPGSAVISIVTPTVFTVTGGGNYCALGTGVNVGQNGSSATETYQLYNAWSPVGPAISGTDSVLNFGRQTTAGSYTVVATNIALGCMDTMAGGATVVINPLPTPNSVTGGGTYCLGGTAPHVSLGGSSVGIDYQLYLGGTSTGTPLSGSGLAIDFGPETTAGSYYVVGRNATTTCSDTMIGSAVIVVKPSPNPYLVTIQNSGNYCAADSGLHIDLSNSDAGIIYELYRGATPVGGLVTGTGGNIDFGLQTVAGSYVITGVNTSSSCSSNMLNTVTLNIIPLPTVYDITGGGSYCSGGDGVDIGLNGSEPAVFYQLFNGPYSAGGMLGTGAPLDFGLQIATGSFVVVGNSVITDCPNMMFGSAVVSYQTLLTPVVTLRAYPGNGISVWQVDSLRAFASNAGSSPTYQWLINGNIIGGATSQSFTNHQFYNNDSITCLVTASGPCGGNTTAESLVLSLANVGVPGLNSSLSNVKLMPNPNKGLFTVKGDLGITVDEEVTLEVVNVMGQVLYSGKVMTQNGSIDRQIELPGSIANGMYLLNLKSGTQNMVFRFVVEQ